MAHMSPEGFEAVQKKVADALGEALKDEDFGEAGMLANFICVAEYFNDEGHPMVRVVFGDSRHTLLLGMLASAQIIVQAGMSLTPD